MINQFQKKILILAVRAGEMMMKSGAEIYRVEDTVSRICKAGRISYVDVFATPTGIFVTLDDGNNESDVFTYVKRIRGGGTDLGKIGALNQFSREFTTTDLSVDEGLKVLEEIDKVPPYPLMVRMIGASLVASFFALMFNGSPTDFLCAFIVGALCYLLSNLLDKIGTNFFIKGLICCFVASFVALACASSYSDGHSGAIIIGTIMLFVPGVAITNSIRDFLTGDMLSGLARITEAIVIAVSLATGTGVMLKIWNALGGIV